MRSLAVVPLTLALGCGGAAQKPCPELPPTPEPPAAAPAEPTPSVAEPEAKSTPAPFTGTFTVSTMSDGKSNVVMADFVKKNGAVDGGMTWEVGKDSFGVGFWQVAQPAPDKKDPAEQLAAFCRSKATVSAHWEGDTMVLASTVSTDGSAEAVRINTQANGGTTTRRTITKRAGCAASFKADHIRFEVLDKDGEGPTKLRATAEDGTFELVRSAPDSAVQPTNVLEGR